jgi:hypothetical protein
MEYIFSDGTVSEENTSENNILYDPHVVMESDCVQIAAVVAKKHTNKHDYAYTTIMYSDGFIGTKCTRLWA